MQTPPLSAPQIPLPSSHGSSFQRAAIALLIAAFAAVALGLALTFLCRGLSFLPAAISLAGGLGVGVFAWRHTPCDIPAGRIHPLEWTLIVVFALASLRAFLWLFYNDGTDIVVLSPNNLGDLPLHLDFIRYLASGVKFWPDSPILATDPLKYPIGADFLNSLLLDAGLPVERGMVWVALLASTVTIVALWRWGRGFAIAAFLFGGGLGGFILFRDMFVGGGLRLVDFQQEATWKNLFLALFVTQRGLLLALPAGLLLLDHWRARYLRSGHGCLPGWGAWLLYSTMPLYNVHAFLYLSVTLGVILIFARDPAARAAAFLFGILSVAPAVLCAWLVTGGFSAGHSVHWQPGWMGPAMTGGWNFRDFFKIAYFWIDNFGLYLLLSVATLALTIWNGSREAKAIIFPAAFMFLLCSFVSFAVWPWDNTKLFLWSWLAFAPYIWTGLIRPLPKPGRGAVCFALFFTGAVSLMAGLDGRHGYKIHDELPLVSLVNETSGAVQHISPEARFACAPEFWHPLIMLGRKVAIGYEGHLSSHGLDYKGKMADFNVLMNASPGWLDAAHRLHVDYLYWGEPESDRYPISKDTWDAKLPVIVSNDDFTIYAIPAEAKQGKQIGAAASPRVGP